MKEGEKEEHLECPPVEGALKLMAHTLEICVQSEKLSRCVYADTGGIRHG